MENNRLSRVLTVLTVVLTLLVLTSQITAGASVQSDLLSAHGATVSPPESESMLTVTGTDEFRNSGPASTTSAVGTITSTDTFSGLLTSESTAVDSTIPKVTISAPSESNTTDVTISGTVTDESTISSATLSYEDNWVGLMLDTTGAYETSVTLPEGATTLTVTATDETGNTESASTNVTVDSIAPVVALSVPGDLASETFELNGSVTDPNLAVVTLTLNGDEVPITLDSNGEFSETLTVQEGINLIALNASDTFGNVASLRGGFDVNFPDTSAPVITFNVPKKTEGSDVTVTGTVSDKSAIESATINVGTEMFSVFVEADGTYSTVVTMQSPGKNDLTMTVTDEFGNTAQESARIIYVAKRDNPNKGDREGEYLIE